MPHVKPISVEFSYVTVSLCHQVKPLCVWRIPLHTPNENLYSVNNNISAMIIHGIWLTRVVAERTRFSNLMGVFRGTANRNSNGQVYYYQDK